jgi:Flp pilus assembly protein TadD
MIVEAEIALQRAVSLKPENPKAHNQLGNVYMYRKQFDIAEKHYRLAIEYDPQYAQAFYNLSLILASQHRYEEQKDALKKFIEHAPPQLANQKQAALVRLQSLPSD